MNDLDAVLDQLASICKPIVASIEARPALTMDRYDAYMSAISILASKASANPNNSVKLAVGVALQRAGANKRGVESALRAIGAL